MEKTITGLDSEFEKKQEEEETKIREINKEIKRKFTRKPYLRKDMLDSTRKRRPEPDGIRRLKNLTEDKLDILRRLKCIPTNQAKEAKELFEGKSSILIRGNPGEGKTTLAFHLIDNEMYRGRRVVLHSPRDWKTVDTDWVDILVIEDVFGKFDLHPGRLQEWMVYLPAIQEYVDAGMLQVIITTRTDILSMAYSRLGSLKLFSDDLTLTLSSKQLTDSEKISILNRELQRHRRNMKEDEKEKCIANFGGLIGFPQCCSLFVSDSKLFSSGPDFFKSPKEFFVQDISSLDSTRFLCLAFLFCNGKIWEEDLSPETLPETSKDLLVELASSLYISRKNAAITLLTDAYGSFLELYVVKSMSDGKFFIQFTNDTVYEAVGQVLGHRCLEMVVKYGDSGYLYQRTYTAEDMDSTSQSVFIPMFLYGLLAKRMVHDLVNRSLVQSIVKHSAFRQHDYLMKLKLELQKGNTIQDFFTAGHDNSIKGIKEGHFTCSSISGEDLSEGVCVTFMQYILQSDEDVVTLVFNEFLEFLACVHINHSSNCWQCEQKQQLLELALYYHHFQIADTLIAMNACYTSVSLCNAAIHGDLGRVQTVLETLKRSQIFSPSCKEAKYALYRAQISGNQSLSLLFLKEGITLDNWNIEDQQSRLHKEDDLVEGDAMSPAERPSMLSGSSHHEHEDVKFTYEDLTHLKEIISAGPDNEEAVEIVDTIKEQDDKRLKTELFQYLAGLLRNEIVSREKHANIRIWPGTTILPTEEIKFVCLYKGKFETQLPRFFGIDIHYKDMDMPEPLIDIENCDLPNWEMTTDQDASLLQSAIEEHGDTLFKEHSNLQVICGGPFLLRNGRVLKQNTIILYCHVKGIIPYGEETFPSLLNFNGIDIPVDIREGHFVLAVGRQEWHEKLCMGISIGEKGVGWAGTLGPFVNLGCNEYGFLTCAHVVGDVGTEVVQPSKGDSKGQKSENETICGTVVKHVFDPEFSDRMNGLTKTGVDAALVKFNKDRGIEATNFPEVQEADLNLIGFAPETKFHYVGGGIGCQRESVKARGKMVIKYGRTTGLRRGVMVLEGAMVKIDDPELYYNEWNSTFTMKGQYLVDGIARYQFAEPGDSGAGVFILDDENKLTLIGLVTGVLDARFDHRCVVTPIEHILTALELPADDLKFHENIEID